MYKPETSKTQYTYLKRIDPMQFPDAGFRLCKNDYADIEHILWKCAHITNLFALKYPDVLEERWCDVLASAQNYKTKLGAIREARKTAERLSLTASTRLV
ncbi:hypothetical protein HPB50_023145 [Hyalomma asiaticum]|uniref:Uncharacterized protein n=1 Tax=Hyalomma asiaticum TaxID=266040 RepID=A0ACB7T1J3_HYAAI|nr:hypothetical protein HPB50_023145 [Hyalomma asiaticum]